MKLIYRVKDKPPFGQTIVFAIQQLLAIMAATLVVPVIIGNGMQPAAALFGAGCGTLVYLLFTKFKSPVFLGSSFAFIGSMFAAFGGAVSAAAGYAGIIIGAIFAGLVYVIIALLVKFVGVGWLNKLMPAVVIGPTVAIIGLSLAGNAIGDMQTGEVVKTIPNFTVDSATGVVTEGTLQVPVASVLLCVLVGVITLIVTTLASTYGKKFMKLIPFICGILAGYAVAAVFTVIGNVADIEWMKIINFSYFSNLLTDGNVTLETFIRVPQFSFLSAAEGLKQIDGGYLATLAAAYLPVAFVVFAEHVADHKNISTIIETDLLEDPGLSRTLLGDGVGSMVGAFFGGCPNTTYGESVACVAISRNASVVTTLFTAIGAILISFFAPFVAFVDSIPPCVMGGVCVALYGFIAVSGLKMLQQVDLNKNRNLFTASSILIAGIGGLTLNLVFGEIAITITAIATALILGIIVNQILSKEKDEEVVE